MSGTTDKAAGVANEVVGGAKRNIGHAVGSERLEAEGMAQEVKGVSRTITKYGSVPKAGIRGSAPPPAMNNPNILRRVARACGRDAR